MIKIEIIKDGDKFYLITKDGVKHFYMDYALPYELVEELKAAFGIEEDE